MQHALIQKKKSEGEQEIVLKLLEEVANDEAISQSRFADRVGIAKGLANLYFNRCLQKGWIKLKHVPRRRYLYYLTPKGFVEKARLTAEFLSYSYQFYREARSDLVATMKRAAGNGHARIAVLGVGELAEMSAIVAHEAGVEVVGFISAEVEGQSFARLPRVACWSDLPDRSSAQAALLATLTDTKRAHDDFVRAQPAVPLYVPSKLKGLIGAS